MAWSIWNYFVDMLASEHFINSLLSGHDRSSLVWRCVFIGTNTNEKPISKAEGILEEIFVACVAQVVDSININISTDGQQRKMCKLADFKENGCIVKDT